MRGMSDREPEEFLGVMDRVIFLVYDRAICFALYLFMLGGLRIEYRRLRAKYQRLKAEVFA